MKTQLQIVCNDDIKLSIKLATLYGKLYSIENNTKTDLESDWHLLSVNYPGKLCKIEKILLNGVDIDYLIYTGYVKTNIGDIVQPATSLWEPGTFYLWLHPNLGIWKKEIFEQIRNNDYGTNLFQQYLLTVDTPVKINSSFPAHIKQFFAHSFGPRWWHNQSDRFPYKKLDISITDKLLQEIDQLEKKLYLNKEIKGWIDFVSGDVATANPMEIGSLGLPQIEKMLNKIGYKQILLYSVLTLESNCYIDMHIDGYENSINLPHLKGCKKFYFAYENHNQDVYFKLGESGLLPLDTPLLINTHSHTHSVVNQSDMPRKVMMVYGIF